jgi:hypothetical protein
MKISARIVGAVLAARYLAAFISQNALPAKAGPTGLVQSVGAALAARYSAAFIGQSALPAKAGPTGLVRDP